MRSYVDDALEQIQHEEGRVLITGNTSRYDFNLTDHLGNTRLSFSDLDGDGTISETGADGSEVLQTDHYYPFGLRMAQVSNFSGVENRYRYNGKEFHSELDLGWYDYGARMYDPSVARWNGVDALAEKFSTSTPYVYTLNNPIFFIDPDGRDTYIYDENGEFRGYRSDTLENQVHYVNSDTYESLVIGAQTEGFDLKSEDFRDISFAFIGKNTARDLRSIARRTDNDANGLEFGGFLYNTKDSKELRLYECTECREKTTERYLAGGFDLKEKPFIDLREHGALPQDLEFYGSAHSHPNSALAHLPSGANYKYRRDGDFPAGVDIARTEQLRRINGGIGAIAYKTGITLYGHDEKIPGNTRLRHSSRNVRAFSWRWFRSNNSNNSPVILYKILQGIQEIDQ